MPITLFRPEGFVYQWPSAAHIEVAPETLVYTTRVTPPKERIPSNVRYGGETRMVWSDLATRYDRCGFDRWIVLHDSRLGHGPVANLHAETQLARFNAFEWLAAHRPDRNVVLHVVCRPEDRGFHDAAILVYAPQGMAVTSNAMIAEAEHTVFKGPKAYWPQIALAEIAREGETARIGIAMAPHVDIEVYLKADAGLAPRKVLVTDGRAEFSFVMLGMEPGRTATVSAGFRLFDGIAKLPVVK